MDVVESMKSYVERMVKCVDGMKILLLDTYTLSYVSVLYTQSQLLTLEIYLIDKIDNFNLDRLSKLSCVVFIRPDRTSLESLKRQVKLAKFKSYYIFFSNVVDKLTLESLAEIDELEVIQSIQEFYGDFVAVNNNLFTFNTEPNLTNLTQSLTSVLLALKKKPIVRYDTSFKKTKVLAEQVQKFMDQELNLFQFVPTDAPPLLLILDRSFDPLSPLLIPWTYQAMVHHYFNLTNGRVNLTIDNKPTEMVLNSEVDDFFQQNKYLNFGDLGATIKTYVEQYQTQTKLVQKIDSISDMKKFVDNYPQFKKLAGNVSKHVSLVGELSTMVDKHSSLKVSELEQSLACNDSHTTDLKALRQMVTENIPEQSKLRLAMLYNLRYQTFNGSLSTTQLQSLLIQNSVSKPLVDLLPKLLSLAGHDQRNNDLFGQSDFFTRSKSVIKGLQGVENVYTQHTPYLIQILESTIKNKLPPTKYPFLSQSSQLSPQDIVVFVNGGITFEEAYHCAQFTQQNQHIRVVLGGDSILNTQLYLDRL